MTSNINDFENNLNLMFNFEIFAHITKFFNKKCIFLGRYNGQGLLKNKYKIQMKVKPIQEFIKLIVSNDGKVKGAVLIGNTDIEETCENLILNQTDISMYGADFLHSNVDLEDMFD